MIFVCPAGTTPEPSPSPSPPQPLALSNGRAGVVAWIQAVLLPMLAWAALLCIGLAGSVGVASQTLANKLAANAQHLQRHGGTSLASRALRRDQLAAMSVQQVAEDLRTVVSDHADGPQLAGEATLRVEEQRADDQPNSAVEPSLTPRNRAHPSRAPPGLA